MILQMYNVKDKISEEFAPPFVAKNDAVALRQFNHLINNLNPQDYSLYHIGQYDSDTGLITVTLPEKICVEEIING